MVATNGELARRGFDAFERGGPEALLPFAHPEIEVYAEAELGNPGTYRGPEAFLRWQKDWLEAWGEFKVEPREFIEVGE